MSKFLSFFACCVLSTLVFPVKAQQARILKLQFDYDARPNSPASDTVFHDAHVPITMAEFTGRPSRSGPSEAVSFTSFSYDGGSRRFRDTLFIHLRLQVFMVKSASWVRGSQSISHTLEHEQLHFDITRIVGERFRKKVLSMPLHLDDYDSIIQYEYLESFREMNKMQEEFDRETGSGVNYAAQARWKQNIRQTLTELGVLAAN
ncbi:hypothetical protein MKQ68_22280 [Chitinophaga horti]|uniref:DUF922 domain-containing protein n=1 Tax=Chitinophaga horti TaxID=2920382 RepID=A0ABY6J2E1_9BACT|nr:hypothetical protein [Chitinophaga horti]UYQ92812.1 hypothetical protein MKQ68_22280 [Chitinophaga horti]